MGPSQYVDGAVQDGADLGKLTRVELNDKCVISVRRIAYLHNQKTVSKSECLFQQ